MVSAFANNCAWNPKRALFLLLWSAAAGKTLRTGSAPGGTASACRGLPARPTARPARGPREPGIPGSRARHPRPGPPTTDPAAPRRAATSPRGQEPAGIRPLSQDQGPVGAWLASQASGAQAGTQAAVLPGGAFRPGRTSRVCRSHPLPDARFVILCGRLWWLTPYAWPRVWTLPSRRRLVTVHKRVTVEKSG